MSNNTTTTASGGIGFFGLITIVFIALKLMGYIDWSWWAVTSPLWGTFLATISIFFILHIIIGIMESYTSRK